MNPAEDSGLEYSGNMEDLAEKTWVRVANKDEIPEDRGLAVKINDKELALFRVKDKLYCLADNCPHRGAALSEGHVENAEIVCPWHGWRYGLTDGECSTLPGSMNAVVFAVKLDGDDVLVQF